MLTVDISNLESDTKDGVVTFVESKLAVKSDREGDVVTFDDKSERTHVSSREIRTYLKRYIHANKLKKKYRLLSEDGTLKFVKSKVEEDEEEEE
ncbi:MAG: hypothetical protein JRN15_19180 [Nitrososphaerota archaeon]|nr:hypothetical protein [Nitrososphaerota archaeon]